MTIISNNNVECNGWEWYEKDRVTKKPTQKPIPTVRPTKMTTQSAITKTPSFNEIKSCVLQCPHTSQYQPLCGSNNMTFKNKGEYDCFLKCGLKGMYNYVNSSNHLQDLNF